MIILYLVASLVLHASEARPVAIMVNASGVSTTTSNPLEGYIAKAVGMAAKRVGFSTQKLVWIDHGESTKKTLEAIDQINQSPASIAIGMGNSFQAMLAGQMMASNKVLISPVATADEILRSRADVVLLGNTNWTQAQILASELTRRASPESRILVARLKGCVYCVSMATYLERALRRSFKNVEVMDLAQLGAGRSDGARQTERFDHIFIPTLEAEAARVLAILWRNNPTATYWGTDGWGSLARYVRELPFAKTLKVFWVTHYHPEVPTAYNRNFVRVYRTTFRSEPVDTSALYYEAATLVFRHLVNAASPLGAFKKLRSYEGITGTVTITGRSVRRPMPLMTLVSGNAKLVKMISLRTANATK